MILEWIFAFSKAIHKFAKFTTPMITWQEQILLVLTTARTANAISQDEFNYIRDIIYASYHILDQFKEEIP